ncbi:MAG TPA: guanylate kinase [Gammaproteobacteria bacterium]|nr:guanylate kinase [Gammaproteobacteria bacterium]
MAELGNLYVISAPSGTGKTTLVKTLVDSLSNITVSISHTTRLRRPAEIHGINYYFIHEPEFKQMVLRDEFLEYATVFNNMYGTSRAWVEETLRGGMDVILEIDWQGAQQIKKLLPSCISIFILPPSLEALSQRLMQRNQDQADIIRKRLADAQETISHVSEYDYVVLNDDFDTALNDLKTIIWAGRLVQHRQIKKLAPLLTELEARVKPE